METGKPRWEETIQFGPEQRGGGQGTCEAPEGWIGQVTWGSVLPAARLPAALPRKAPAARAGSGQPMLLPRPGRPASWPLARPRVPAPVQAAWFPDLLRTRAVHLTPPGSTFPGPEIHRCEVCISCSRTCPRRAGGSWWQPLWRGPPPTLGTLPA